MLLILSCWCNAMDWNWYIYLVLSTFSAKFDEYICYLIISNGHFFPELYFLFCTLEDVCICIAALYILRLIVIIIGIMYFSLSLINLWPTTWVVDSIHWVHLHLEMTNILDNFALYIICINISNRMWYKMFWHLQTFSVHFTRYSRCSFPPKDNGSRSDIVWKNFGNYGIDQSPADEKSNHTCNDDDHCKNWSSSKIDQIRRALLFMCFCFIHSCVNRAWKISQL